MELNPIENNDEEELIIKPFNGKQADIYSIGKIINEFLEKSIEKEILDKNNKTFRELFLPITLFFAIAATIVRFIKQLLAPKLMGGIHSLKFLYLHI